MVGALVLGTQVPATAAQAGVRPPAHRDVPSQVPVGALLSATPRLVSAELGAPLVPPSEETPPPAAVPQPPASGRPVDCRRAKCIALTLDDGPSPQTARVLDDLARLKVPATFFVIGRQAAVHPQLLRRMVAEGHTVGNHSWSHPWFWKQSARKMRAELDRTDTTIRRITGVEPKYFRPPYGNVNRSVTQAAKSRGLAIVDWSVDPQDWKSRNTAAVTAKVVGTARPGAIILGHDLYPSTRKALPGIVQRLRAKGYVFVSLDELLGRTRPGRVYRQR